MPDSPIQSSSDSCVGATRRAQLIEVGVFLFLVLPSVVVSLFAIRRGSLNFPTIAASIILRDLALVALILYFLWHNREPRALIGWSARNAGREVLAGLLLYLPVAFAAGALAWALREMGLSLPSGPPDFLRPHGAGETALAVGLVAVVAVAEETIFRGYLIRRFAAITGSTPAAVVISAVIFSLGHGYEGSAGLIAVGFLGALYALVYLWRGSLIAPITMHFLQNFLGLVVAPWILRHFPQG